MLDKLKSRKFWVTVAAGSVTIFATELGLEPEVVQYLVGLASAYILGQSYVDRGAALAATVR